MTLQYVEPDMTGMAAVEAQLPVLLRVHNQKLIGLIQISRITEANEMGEGRALGMLDGKVLHPVSSTRKVRSPPRVKKDPAKGDK